MAAASSWPGLAGRLAAGSADGVPSAPPTVGSAAAECPRERVSAAMDGEAEACDALCRAWREDAQAREAWGVYHLIGDVMRAPETARSPAHDSAFLLAFRARLAAEPVVLAPAPLDAPAVRAPAEGLRSGLARAGMWRWWRPAAAVASVAVVGGVWLVATGDSRRAQDVHDSWALNAPAGFAPAAVEAPWMVTPPMSAADSRKASSGWRVASGPAPVLPAGAPVVVAGGGAEGYDGYWRAHRALPGSVTADGRPRVQPVVIEGR